MNTLRVGVLVSVVSLGGLLGCGRRDAAIKQCHEQCDKAMKDAESHCVGPGADTCRSVVKTNSTACTESCEKAASGGRTRIRF